MLSVNLQACKEAKNNLQKSDDDIGSMLLILEKRILNREKCS